MSLKEEMKEILGIKKMQKEDVERLHPPKPIVSETEMISSKVALQGVGELPAERMGDVGSNPTHTSKLAIDFNNLDPKYKKWCISLETQRHYYYTKFGKTHREDTKAVKRDLANREVELDMITLMKKKQAPFFKECMKELELKLQEKRVE